MAGSHASAQPVVTEKEEAASLSVRRPLARERVTGVEPATLCLASIRSSQLSYTRTRSLLLAKAVS